MVEKKIASVFIPDIHLEVCLAMNPEVASQPVVVAEENIGRSKVISVNQHASVEGVKIDMTVAQAKSRCHTLVVLIKSDMSERNRINSITKSLLSIGPFVEFCSPGRFYLDVSGLQRHYQQDSSLAETILFDILKQCRACRVGIAANKFVASVAASVADDNSYNVVPLGKERSFLNRLSVSHLPVSDDTISSLRQLGLLTIGQVAKFSANEMSARFSEEGKKLSRLARGADSHLLDIFIAPEEISFRIISELAGQSIDQLIREVERVLENCFETKKISMLGCRQVDTILIYDKCKARKYSVRLCQPTLIPGRFVKQLRMNLEKRPVTSPVTEIIVKVSEFERIIGTQLRFESLEPLSPQNSIETSNQPHDPMKEFPYCRLESSLIPDHQHVVKIDKPTPDYMALPESSIAHRRVHYSLYPPAGLRLVRPPQKIMLTSQDGKLDLILFSNCFKTITGYKGPWRISGNWWEECYDRLYYEITTDEFCRYLFFYDSLSSDWYLQGIFD